LEFKAICLFRSELFMKKYFLLFILSIIIFFSHASITRHAIYGDGNGYYSYTQALYFERSLNFKPVYNYLQHFQGRTGEFSRTFWGTEKYNPFSIGTGIVWIPSMLVMSIFGSDRFSLIYELGPGITGIVCMLAGLYFIEKFLSRRYSKKVVFWTILTIFFGSSIFYYTAFEPALSHQPAFLIVSLLLYMTMDDNKKVNLFIVGLLSGLLVNIRIGDAILLIPIFYSVKNKGWSLIYLVPGFLLGFSPQLINQWAQFHNIFYNPYLGGGTGSWNIVPIHLLEFLFSPKRGLFTWSPVLLLAIYGLFKLKQTTILIALGIVWIVSSFWSAYLSAGFGQRFMFSAIPYFSIGIAYVFEKVPVKASRWVFLFFSIYNFILLVGFYFLNWKNLP